MTEATTTPATKKPAFIAFDATLSAGETEHQGLGVGFSHRDGNGYDLLLDGIPLSGKMILRTPGASPAAVEPPTGCVPAKRPDFLAYVVGERKGADGKARWRLIGFAYRHEDGEGCNLIYRTVPVSGRIALRVNDKQ